jgi:hypothetical protein
MRFFACLFGLYAGALFAAPSNETALLIDAAGLSPAARQSLIGQASWWVGMQNQTPAAQVLAKLAMRPVQFSHADLILIATPAALSARLAARYPVLQRYEHVTADSFALQSLACDQREGAPRLPAVAAAGRGNVVLRPLTSGAEKLQALPLNQQLTARTEPMPRSKAINPATQEIVNLIDPTRWFGGITQLAVWKRNSYGAEVDLARDWLANQFAGLGFSVQTPTFNVGSAAVQMENVIGTKTGSTLPNEWIVIGAHYDSRNVGLSNTTNPSPGAEDNASGCSGVLEMARILAPYRFKRTLKFMCFGGEEQNLYGSEAYAASLQAAGDLPKVKLAIMMDMIGYSSDAQTDVLLETSSAQQAVLPAFQQAAADYSPGMNVLTSLNPFGSDHVPFLNRSVPTLLLIENEWDTYPQYHKATDTPANVTNALSQGPAILRMMAAVLVERAELFDSYFSNGFEN